MLQCQEKKKTSCFSVCIVTEEIRTSECSGFFVCFVVVFNRIVHCVFHFACLWIWFYFQWLQISPIFVTFRADMYYSILCRHCIFCSLEWRVWCVCYCCFFMRLYVITSYCLLEIEYVVHWCFTLFFWECVWGQYTLAFSYTKKLFITSCFLASMSDFMHSQK